MAWSQEDLAEAAGVSVPTIKRLEANGGPLGGRTGTGAKIQARWSVLTSNSSTRMVGDPVCDFESPSGENLGNEQACRVRTSDR
jgi:predicted transcriptional regulator